MGMADGYCSVFVQKELGDRKSDDIASSYYHGAFAFNLHISCLQQADNAARGARDAVFRIILRLCAATPQGRHIFRMETVHILLSRDGIESLHLVYMVRERELNENAVDTFIFVQQPYLLQEGLFGSILRQMYCGILYSYEITGLPLAPHIGRAGRVIAYEDNCQMRHSSVFFRKSGHFLGQLCLNIVR